MTGNAQSITDDLHQNLEYEIKITQINFTLIISYFLRYWNINIFWCCIDYCWNDIDKGRKRINIWIAILFYRLFFFNSSLQK